MFNTRLSFVFLVSILILSNNADGKKSDDLSNEQLDMIKLQFREIIRQGNMTCENYKSKCQRNNPKMTTICETFAKQVLCDGLNSREGTREVIHTIEVDNPKFVDHWEDDENTDDKRVVVPTKGLPLQEGSEEEEIEPVGESLG